MGNAKHLKRLFTYVIMTKFYSTIFSVLADIQEGVGSLDDLESSLEQEMIDQLQTKLIADGLGVEASSDLVEQIAPVVDETIIKFFHGYKASFVRRFQEQFGEDAEKEIEKASAGLHQLRLKTMYVEEDGWSPLEAWESMTEDDAKMFKGFHDGTAFDIATFHIGELERRLRSEWSEFSKFLPGADRMSRLENRLLEDNS